MGKTIYKAPYIQIISLHTEGMLMASPLDENPNNPHINIDFDEETEEDNGLIWGGYGDGSEAI